LTHGEICAHLAEVYGAEVSKQTITTITDRVMDGMAEWQNRPLDAVYAVVFIDAINVKIRDGLKGLPDAVNAVWAKAIVQTCIVHLLRNSFKYASKKDWGQIAKDLKP